MGAMESAARNPAAGWSRRDWRLAVPPVVAAGFAYFAWAVAGALHHGTAARAAVALAAPAALLALWLTESRLLARFTGLGLTGAARHVALSWLPLLLLGFSAPYFSHRIYSSFLGSGSTARIAALALWLLAVAAAGSVAIKFVLIPAREGRMAAWLERRAVRLLWAGVAIYFVIFVSLAFLAYHWYNSYYGSDLGQYAQTLWATLRGHFFYSSLEETSPDSFLSTHVPPFLLLLLPIYAIKQSPMTYLLLRSLALALAAVPLFYCVRLLTRSAIAGLLLGAAFLLNPEIVSQHFTAGYEVVFVAGFFFAAFYFFERRRFGWFLFFLVLTLSVREDFVPAALMFAVYALLARAGRRWWLAPLGLWVFWQGADATIMQLKVVYFNFNLYYGHFGSSPAELVKTVLTHPVYALQEIWHLHLSYLYNLMMPEGFLMPLAGLAAIFALPSLGLTLLRGQDISAAAGGVSHYSVLVVCALILGVAQFIALVQRRREKRLAAEAGGNDRGIEQAGTRDPGAAQAAIASSRRQVALVVSILTLALVAGSAHIWFYHLPLHKPADADALSQALSLIPSGASVSSNDGRALTHLWDRMGLYEPLVRDVLQPPDYLPQGIDQLRGVDYVVLKPFGNPMYDDSKVFAFATDPAGPYRLIFDRDGIRVYKLAG